MTIDIFQYSNMYTLCRSIEWLADETHVREECGPYVTRRGEVDFNRTSFRLLIGEQRSRSFELARLTAPLFEAQGWYHYLRMDARVRRS